MNQSLYRLVFNAARGMLVPVCEGVPACGKRASSATGMGVALALTVMGAGAADAATLTAPPPLPVKTTNPNLSFVQKNSIGSVDVVTTGKTMQINQTANNGVAKAILNWDRFDIARGYRVNFKQDAGGVVLNKVSTPSGAYAGVDPRSVINGTLTANGQIYIYNQNGILFGKGAQVNVGGLVASALKFDEKAFLRKGIFAGGYSGTGQSNASPALFWAPDFDGKGFNSTSATHAEYSKWVNGQRSGDTWIQYANAATNLFRQAGVTVEPGARLVAASGGVVMLVAPRVENRGSIVTPDGQAMLVGGGKVFLTLPTKEADSLAKGFVVEVGPYADCLRSTCTGSVLNEKLTQAELAAPDADDPSRSVAALAAEALADNGAALPAGTDTLAGVRALSGEMRAERGKINLVGFAVNQAGRVSATTSVLAGGGIFLTAGHALSTSPNLTTEGGTLVLGRTGVGGAAPDGTDSVTEVLPEQSTATQPSGVTQPTSMIEMKAQSVVLAKGSTTRATGGKVTVTAAADPAGGVGPQALSPSTAKGQVTVAQGATVDVSGADSTANATDRYLAVGLFGQEFADSPLQRNGILYRRTVHFDATKNNGTGLKLASVSDYINAVGQTASQRLRTGGTISITSSGSVDLGQGATLNVSGGKTSFAAGTAKNTYVRSTYGGVYEISAAPAGLQYAAVWERDVSVPAYSEGANAGTLELKAPQVSVSSTLAGRVTVGEYQRSAVVAPKGGKFNFTDPTRAVDARVLERPESVAVAVWGHKVVIGDSGGETLTLAPALLADGFASLSIKALGEVDFNSPLYLPVGGSVTVVSDTAVRVAADIAARGGSIDLRTAAKAENTRNVSTAPGVRLDVSGTWVNDYLRTDFPLTGVAAVKGGTVALSSMAGVSLGRGSVIDASGGGWLSASGSLTGGEGGTITLAAGGVVTEGTSTYTRLSPLLLSSARLSAYGYQGSAGGTLNLLAPSIDVSASAKAVSSSSQGLTLPTAFFSQGGFAKYLLGGLSGVEVEAGAQIAPTLSTLLLAPVAGVSGGSLASGANLADAATYYSGVAGQRQAVSLDFSAVQGDVRVGQGAQIVTEAKGSLTLSANNSAMGVKPGSDSLYAKSGSVYVNGTLAAPGGSISLTVGGTKSFAYDVDKGVYFTSTDYAPQMQDSRLWLGPQAVLDARGTALVTTGVNGLLGGSVLNGGSVNLKASGWASIVAEAGSRIDVSGTSALLDLPTAVTTAGVTRDVMQRRQVDSAGGAISFSSASGLFSDATLNAQSGGAGAAGGSFSASLQFSFDTYTKSTTGAMSEVNDFAIVVAPTLTLNASGGATAGLAFKDYNDGGRTLLNRQGQGALSAQAINNGGFASVSLAADGSVRLNDQAHLRSGGTMTLETPHVVADGTASLSAPIVTVQNTDKTKQKPKPNESDTAWTQPLNAGAAHLSLTGTTLAEVTGFVTIDGLSALTVQAPDVRLNGLELLGGALNEGGLRTSGDLNVLAGQVYPSSATSFTVISPNTLTISKLEGATPQTPLSAGGELTLSAYKIEQDGVLRAPFGTLTLDAGEYGSVRLGAGSETSVSAPAGFEMLYGWGRNGTDWVVFSDTILTAPVSREVVLKGQSIVLEGAAATQVAAQVDVSGRGTLMSYLWVPGLGGKQDYLAAPDDSDTNVDAKIVTRTGTANYAILPDYQADYAPYEAGSFVENATGKALAGNLTKSTLPQVGRRVYLSGVPGVLKAGYYTLLPARYALLPGALVVTALDKTSDFTPTKNYIQPDGAAIMSGQLITAGMTSASNRSQAFLVETAKVFRAKSEYSLFEMDSFFAKKAALTGATLAVHAADGGHLRVLASQHLQLAGTTDFSPGTGGLGGEFDLQGLATKTMVYNADGTTSVVTRAPQIAVLGNGATAAEGELAVSVDELNAMAVRDIVIGGARTADAEGNVTLEVGADEVRVNTAGETLHASGEVLLAANRTIEVEAGSRIDASGTSDLVTPEINLVGDSAVLRVATEKTFRVTRADPASSRGDVLIGAGVALSGGVLELDAAHDAAFGDGGSLSFGAVSLGARQIGLGSSSGDGLNLSPSAVSALGSISNLKLQASQGIRFANGIALGGVTSTGAPTIDTLVIDSPVVRGVGTSSGAATRVVARSVVLRNTFGSDPEASTTSQGYVGTGALEIDALAGSGGTSSLVLGSGSHSISGFASTRLGSAGDVVFSGNGGASGMTVYGDLTLRGQRLTVDAAATTAQTLKVNGKFESLQGEGVSTSAAGRFGSIKITADSAVLGGTVVLPSGDFSVTARDADGISVAPGTSINVQGVRQDYAAGSTVFVDGGTVSLTAETGDIAIAPSARIDVSAQAGGGSAGALSLSAPLGQIKSEGTLLGHAGNSGSGGTFVADAANFDSATLSGLISSMTTGGFDNAIQMRVRNGDLTLAAGTATLKAKTIELDADSGLITVGSRLDASGASGGSIALWGNGGVHLTSTGVLDAHATDAAGTGGSVVIAASRVDTTDGVVALDADGMIDVSGGKDGQGGDVRLRAVWEDDSTTGVKLAINPVGSTIRGAKQVVVEGVSIYEEVSLISGTLVPGAANQLVLTTPDSFASLLKGKTGTSAPGIADKARAASYFLSKAKTAAERQQAVLLANAYLVANAVLSASVTIESPDIDGSIIKVRTDNSTLIGQDGRLTLSLGETASALFDSVIATGMTQIGIDTGASAMSASMMNDAKAAFVEKFNGSNYADAAGAAASVLKQYKVQEGSILYQWVSGSATLLAASDRYLTSGSSEAAAVVASDLQSAFPTVASVRAGLTAAIKAYADKGDAAAVLYNSLTYLGVDGNTASAINDDLSGLSKASDFSKAATLLQTQLSKAGYADSGLIGSAANAMARDSNSAVGRLLAGRLASTAASTASDNKQAIIGLLEGYQTYERFFTTATPGATIVTTLKSNVTCLKVGSCKLDEAKKTLEAKVDEDMQKVGLSQAAFTADLNATAKAAGVTIDWTKVTTTVTNAFKGTESLVATLSANQTTTADTGFAQLNNMQLFADNAAFFAHSDAILKNTGLKDISGVSVQSGIEVRSSGNLALSSLWDFTKPMRIFDGSDLLQVSAWKGDSGNGNGTLTLRAKGNLVIANPGTSSTSAYQAGLSDGFVTSGSATSPDSGVGAWGYRLVGGADLTAAAPMTTVASRTSGDVIIGYAGLNSFNSGSIFRASVVRAGTGDIEIAAGHDMRLASADSAIYTAGTPLDTMSVSVTPYYVVTRDATGEPELVFKKIKDQNIAQNGGDISIRAANDVAVGSYFSVTTKRDAAGKSLSTKYGIPATGIDPAASTTIDNGDGTTTTNSFVLMGTDVANGQLMSNWLLRQANTSVTSGAWWVDYDKFKQNVGSFGGGNIQVTAGRNVENLSVMAPTSGLLASKKGIDGKFTPVGDATGLVTYGGGDVSVVAGGDIKGGQFMVMRGTGTLTANGALREGAALTSVHQGLYPILALADGSWDVQARGDAAVEAVLNPTLLTQAGSAASAYFSTYSENSRASVVSLSGNAVLAEGAKGLHANATKDLTDAGLGRMFGLSGSEASSFFGWQVLPSQLRLASVSGDVVVGLAASESGNELTLAPSSQGKLELLAGNSVQILSATGMMVSDLAVDPASDDVRFPDVLSPASAGDIDEFKRDQSENTGVGRPPVHAAGDVAAVVVALNGDVQGIAGYDSSGTSTNAASGAFGNFMITTPTSAFVSAGRDIVDFSVLAQNLSASDVTQISAGRDIVFTAQTAGSAAAASKGAIVVAGPGALEVTAGRNVDLGTSVGIVTRGNLINPALPAEGASVKVIAGAVATLDTEAFVTRYLDPAARADSVASLARDLFDKVGTDVASVSIATLQATVTPARAGYLKVLADWVSQWKGTGNEDVRMSREQQALTAFLKLSRSEQQAFIDARANSYVADLGAFLGSPLSDTSSLLQTFRQLSAAEQKRFAEQVTVKEFMTQYLTANTADDAGMAARKVQYISDWQTWVARHGIDPAQVSYAQLAPFAQNVMMSELRDVGRESVAAGARTVLGWGRSFAALDGAELSGVWQHTGGISLTNSLISTHAGGDITLIAAGGGVNLGLLTPTAGISKDAANLGVIAMGKGSRIQIVSRDDVLVNQSRAFTLGGGDILAFSSHGSIDAGKGARGAQVVPPPKITINSTGSIEVSYASTVSGSGIGALLTDPNSTAEPNVDLFAPLGEINAGDAGIRTSGKITLGAVAIRNADVIVGGSLATGVAVSVPPVTVPTPPIQERPVGMADDPKIGLNPDRVDKNSILTVDFLGLGDEGDEGDKGDKGDKSADSGCTADNKKRCSDKADSGDGTDAGDGANGKPLPKLGLVQ